MTTGASPRVTVLMAVHNSAAFLDDAIRSILAQTYADFEFLIVDDGSTDATAAKLAAVRDPRVRVVSNEANVGLTRSLNRGLALARGAFVARQDADDVSHRERLAKQVAFLDRHPEVVVVGAQARIVDGRGRTVRNELWPKLTSNLAISWQIMFDSPFVHGSVMFRRDAIAALGGYDERFTTSQDYELWCRVAAAGSGMRNLPERLMDFRVHERSVSSNYQPGQVERVRGVMLASLTRQLGGDAAPPGWPDSWLRVSNPRLYPDRSQRCTDVAPAVGDIYARFVARYPEAAASLEIRRHRAALLMRIAQLRAGFRDFTSLPLLLEAWRLDPAIAAGALGRYAGRLLRGSPPQ